MENLKVCVSTTVSCLKTCWSFGLLVTKENDVFETIDFGKIGTKNRLKTLTHSGGSGDSEGKVMWR
jgi:hypothetical protein